MCTFSRILNSSLEIVSSTAFGWKLACSIRRVDLDVNLEQQDGWWLSGFEGSKIATF